MTVLKYLSKGLPIYWQELLHGHHINTITLLSVWSISFISDAWGARNSENFITEPSGFLNRLLPGYIVLDDRGFDIQESVGLTCADVKILYFTKGKQLSAREFENTFSYSRETLRNKHQIVSDTMPVEYLVTSEENQVPMVDKFGSVRCGLTNLCQSVILFN